MTLIAAEELIPITVIAAEVMTVLLATPVWSAKLKAVGVVSVILPPPSEEVPPPPPQALNAETTKPANKILIRKGVLTPRANDDVRVPETLFPGSVAGHRA